VYIDVYIVIPQQFARHQAHRICAVKSPSSQQPRAQGRPEGRESDFDDAGRHGLSVSGGGQDVVDTMRTRLMTSQRFYLWPLRGAGKSVPEHLAFLRSNRPRSTTLTVAAAEALVCYG